MIFIGDSTTDYKASKLLNIPFIEASIIAKNNQLKTLIKYEKNHSREFYFDTYESKKLLELIDCINESNSI